jgi:hypothetical protein
MECLCDEVDLLLYTSVYFLRAIRDAIIHHCQPLFHFVCTFFFLLGFELDLLDYQF